MRINKSVKALLLGLTVAFAVSAVPASGGAVAGGGHGAILKNPNAILKSNAIL
jgi:hypothetical protein